MSSELTHNPGQFDEVIHIIDNARSRAMKAVNAELIQMYWSVGAYLSELCSASSFGDKIIDEVAAYIAQENPNIKGFNRRGLYRMKQFYETYRDDEFVTPLVTQISWTNHLLIMFWRLCSEFSVNSQLRVKQCIIQDRPSLRQKQSHRLWRRVASLTGWHKNATMS